MKRSVCILSIGIVLSVLSHTAPAQFHLGIAPDMGVNFNLHTGSDLSSNGNGLGFLIGAETRMTFAPMIGLEFGVTFYDGRSGSATIQLPNSFADSYFEPYRAAVLSALPPDVHHVSVSLGYIQIESLFLLKLPRTGIFFVAGPAVGFSIQNSADDDITHQEPQDYGFNGNNQFTFTSTTTMHEKQSGSLSKLGDMNAHFELKFGAGYEIPVARKMMLVPQLTFGYALNDVVSGVNWKVLTFQLRVPFEFNLI